jgi:hypothetical protein
MAKYKIYYGLGGSFGGAKYDSTEEFDTQDEAMDYAYDCAAQQYESYSGRNGLPSYKDVSDELLEEYEEVTDDDIDQAYNEAMERWLSYKVELVEEEI